MTRKEFVLQVTEQLKANPAAVLRGHGIKPALIGQIAERDDILAKLVLTAYSTVYAKLGPKALRKKPNFTIKAYKNFPTFNLQGRDDVETFVNGLPDKDLENFNIDDNSLVILALPSNTGDVENTVEENITTGKSTLLKFSSSVKKEYKVAGGFYVVIMWGDSAIRSAEQIKAEAKAKSNARKVKVAKTPAKIKAELKKKAVKELDKLKKTRKALQAQKARLTNQLQEIETYGQQLGLGKGRTAADILAYQKSVDKLKSKFGVNEKSSIKAIRIKNLRDEINRLRKVNKDLLSQITVDTSKGRIRSIQSMVSKNKAKLNVLKNKLAMYDATYTVNDWNTKTEMIQNLTKEIENNISAGLSVTQSLNSAIAELDLPAQQKLQIQEAAVEEIVENGVDVVEAAETAAQQVVMQEVQQVTPAPKKRGRKTKVATPQFSKSAKIEDILAGI